MLKVKDTDFFAVVRHVWACTRFKESGFSCLVVHGELRKGDVVQFLDAEGNLIVQQEVKIISHTQQNFDLLVCCLRLRTNELYLSSVGVGAHDNPKKQTV